MLVEQPSLSKQAKPMQAASLYFDCNNSCRCTPQQSAAQNSNLLQPQHMCPVQVQRSDVLALLLCTFGCSSCLIMHSMSTLDVLALVSCTSMCCCHSYGQQKGPCMSQSCKAVVTQCCCCCCDCNSAWSSATLVCAASSFDLYEVTC